MNVLFQSQVVVQMSMEISPQHHPILLGKSSANLKLIMQRTSTQILFPDAGDPNIPSIKKSNVMISGQINNVYLARQQLLVSRQSSLCCGSGSCHKRQKPQAPTPQAPIRNRQTRKVAKAKGLNRNTNFT